MTISFHDISFRVIVIKEKKQKINQGIICVGFFKIGIFQKNKTIFSIAFASLKARFFPILFLSL